MELRPAPEKQVTFRGCDRLARCRAPYVGPPSTSSCPSRNTNPNAMVDFQSPFCHVPDCPEPIPAGYAKTSHGYRCAPGFGGTVLSSCTTCGRLVLTGCYTAIPCKSLEVEDTCRYNVSDCSVPTSAGESCMITCGNAYEGEPTWATCPADNIDLEGKVVAAVMPQCELSCPDPNPMPEGYEFFVDYLGRREIRCTLGYVGQAESECRLLPGCRSELQLGGCIKLQPCLPLQLAHAERYEMPGCDRVMPGHSCRVSCRDPWSGPQVWSPNFDRSKEVGDRSTGCASTPPELQSGHTVSHDRLDWRDGEALASCPMNNINPEQCSLRCDSVPVGYERVQDGRWRCAPGFLGTVEPKKCYERGRCKEAPGVRQGRWRSDGIEPKDEVILWINQYFANLLMHLDALQGMKQIEDDSRRCESS
ncbi:Uncharacterized protein SCF082_LOCUS41650 [Durusdinium trenchii]|uniref:Uncharacterized protein n=1 Tax=Durusdinium trenchii TaxID=1381693 RepID=A0ABP0QJJ8_9DINO